MAEKHISLNEAHRRYGVALSTLRRKINEGTLTRVDGKGITVASLKRLYGDPSDQARTGESDTPQREGERRGSALPSERGSAPRSEGVARGGAIPPDQAAELAALRAERDTLKATLEHERSDREKERKAWGDKYDLLAHSMIAVKGADYARDMASAKLPPAQNDIIDGEASEASRDGNPQSPPRAERGAKQKTAKTETDEAPRSARGGLWGLLARFRR